MEDRDKRQSVRQEVVLVQVELIPEKSAGLPWLFPYFQAIGFDMP